MPNVRVVGSCTSQSRAFASTAAFEPSCASASAVNAASTFCCNATLASSTAAGSAFTVTVNGTSSVVSNPPDAVMPTVAARVTWTSAAERATLPV